MTEQTYEAAMIAFAKAHDFRRVDTGSELSDLRVPRFVATVWWDGYSNDATCCEMASGATVNEALENVAFRARIKRTPPAVELPVLMMEAA